MITYNDWWRLIKSVSFEEQPLLIYKSLEDKEMLPIFAQHFLSDQIYGIIPECHYCLAESLSSPNNEAIIMPRGHGKTSWTRADLIHDIVYKKEPFILLIGHSSRDSNASFSYIRSQLENNELLRYVYGNLVPAFSSKSSRKWSDSHIETTNDVILLSFGKGKGRGLNYKGSRPTKAIVDDMEDKQEVKNELIRKKDSDWLFQTLMPAMKRKVGKIKMIGTVLHHDCILLDFYKKFGGIRRAAIEDENGRPSLDGQPIWWEAQELEEQKRRIGSFAFAQEFMNDPSTDENSDVKLNWIKIVDDINIVDTNDRALYKIFSALDPSVGAKQTSDESAICTLALKLNSSVIDITVLSCVHGRWNLPKTVEECKRVFNRYNHEAFGIEVVAFQEHLRQVISTSGIPARPITVTKDKRARLQQIVGLIEYGNIKFSRNCDDLITQLVQFPNADHDDRVDAFVHAVNLALDNLSSEVIAIMI